MFAFRDTMEATSTTSRVDVAFTDSTLDLHEQGDRLDAALADLEAAAGVPLVRLSQVHGDEVQVVDPAAAVGAPREGDALVTTTPGLGLVVRAADCLPVLLADPEAGVIGAVHAGRAGMALGVAARTVEAMRDHGAGPITAWLGPHVCGRCYEVPERLQDDVAAVVPEARGTTSWGTPSLDIGAGVRAQLERADVAVVDVARCTLEDTALHSYRRDGGCAGRLAGLVWLS